MLNFSFGVDSLFNQARHAFADGDLERAKATCAQVLQQQSNHPQALHLLGAIALHDNQSDVAAEYLRQTLTLQPENAAAHCDFATSLQEIGQPEAAIRHYRLALALDPNLQLAQEKLHELRAAQGSADPAAIPVDPAYVSDLRALAHRAAVANDLPRTIRLCEQLLDVDAQQPDLLARLGDLYVQTGNARSAIDVLMSAVALGHRSAGAHHNLAKALRKRLLIHEALDAARAGAALDPNDLDLQWTVTQLISEAHQRDSEIATLRAALAAHPDSDDLKFQLALLTDDVDLSTFPVSRAAMLFDHYADKFESHLVNHLKYRGHEQIFDAVVAAGITPPLDILDLGCGTGLCGVKFKPLARFLRGVDVSPAMMEQARARGIYDDLEVTDLATVLQRERERYDLILAADVFEYVGNLEATFAGAATALRTGGLFAFTVERTDRAGLVFNRRTTSFRHSLGYIQGLAAKFGMREISAQDFAMRQEGRTATMAWLVVLRKG